VWESNPPFDSLGAESPALKAGTVTGPFSPPQSQHIISKLLLQVGLCTGFSEWFWCLRMSLLSNIRATAWRKFKREMCVSLRYREFRDSSLAKRLRRASPGCLERRPLIASYWPVRVPNPKALEGAKFHIS
jgi:hypothetical protein